jgi:hypothetical protein
MIIKKPSKEELETKYKELGSTRKIGGVYGVDAATAWNWMNKCRIKRNKSTNQISLENRGYKNRPSKKELEKKYKEFGGCGKVGEYYKVNPSTIHLWLKEDGIKINKSSRQISQEKKPSKEELEQKCKELKYNGTKVGEYYKVSKGAASRWIKEYGIEIIKKPSKEEIEQKCKEIGYSCVKVGGYYSVSPSTALKWMKDDKIKTNKQLAKEKMPSKEEFEAKFKEMGYNTDKVRGYYKSSLSTAYRWMKDYGIETGKSIQLSKEKRPSKEELEQKYKELESLTKVGEYYNVNAVTACNWMKEAGIERNKSTNQISKEKKPSKEELEKKYKELGSTAKVGKYYGVCEMTALKWMKDYGVERRKSSMQFSKEKKPSKEELDTKYKKLGSAAKVGKYYGVSDITALNWMKSYEIKTGKINSLEQTVDLYLGAGK